MSTNHTGGGIQAHVGIHHITRSGWRGRRLAVPFSGVLSNPFAHRQVAASHVGQHPSRVTHIGFALRQAAISDVASRHDNRHAANAESVSALTYVTSGGGAASLGCNSEVVRVGCSSVKSLSILVTIPQSFIRTLERRTDSQLHQSSQVEWLRAMLEAIDTNHRDEVCLTYLLRIFDSDQCFRCRPSSPRRLYQ